MEKGKKEIKADAKPKKLAPAKIAEYVLKSLKEDAKAYEYLKDK